MSTSSDSRTIAILNGPNLNLLGTRQPEIYGHDTLADIEAMCAKYAKDKGFQTRFAQTNVEGELVTLIQESRGCAAMLINAAAYTHTSVAVLDALLAVETPVIEVHLSSPHKREAIRHRSVIAPACHGVIAGFGALSYRLALDAAIALAESNAGITEG